jgi:chorismate mutase/prephenate dehydratase
MNLDKIRDEIDKIDNELLSLFNQRMELVKQVGDLKNKEQSAIYRPERERSIITRLQNLNKANNGNLTDEVIENLFYRIFDISKASQSAKQ